MRFGVLLLLVSAIVFLTACGQSAGASASPATGTPRPLSLPAAGNVYLRALLPADLNGDGVADTPVHGSLRRMVVQAPANARISLTRNDTALAVIETRTYTMPGGEVLHELELAQPLGDRPCVLRAGAYELKLLPSLELAEQQDFTLRPAKSGGVTNDLVNPAAAVFESPADVQLLMGGTLPSLFGPRLNLVSGEAEPIELDYNIGLRGVTLVPKRAPLAGRAYRVAAAKDMSDGYGRELAPRFHLSVHPVGTVALCLADLNRDGQEDLVVLWRDGRLAVLTDPAAGAAEIPLGVTGTGLGMAVGDFDGNGACDIAVLMQVKEGLRLLRLLNETRQGKMSFSIRVEAVTPDAPFKVVTGDFDRDGLCDIAVAGSFGGLQVMYSRLGLRTFTGLLEGGLCLDVLALDYNRDGNLDFLLLSADGKSRVLAGRGDSPLPAKPPLVEINTGGALRLRTADFDADHRPDLALTGAARTARVIVGAGGSKILPLTTGEEDTALSGAAVARDMTGNKRADMIVMREDARGLCPGFAVYLNTGEGLPEQPDAVMPLEGGYAVNCLEYWRHQLVLGGELGLYLLPLGPIEIPMRNVARVRFLEAYAPIPRLPAPLSAAVADFNGDGRADIAALDATGRLTLWLAGAPGESFLSTTTSINLEGPGRLVAIDFDKDSFPDLLFIPADSGARPRLLRNRRDGNLSDDWEGLLPAPPRDLLGAPALGDFDQDGDLDCLWPSPVGRLQYNDGQGRWRDGPALPAAREGGRVLYFSGELCCADFSGRGKADVAAVMQPEDGSEQFLVLFENTGREDEPFIARVCSTLRGRIFSLTPGDFNGDGRLDLAVGYARAGESARLTLLSLGPDGAFAGFDGSPAPKGELLSMSLDDLDSDGDLDLVIAERVEGEVVVTLWMNNGRGFVEGGPADDSLREALRGFAATNLSLADFTGDGRPDLLALDKDGNVVLIRSFNQP